MTRVRPRRRTVEIRTDGGTVTASKVVIASGFPTDDFKPLHRRFARCDSYIVMTAELPAGVRREMTPPGVILRDTASPDHWLHWVGNSVLFSGADQATRARPRKRANDRAADRPVDVRAVGHAVGDFGLHAGILLGCGVFADDRRCSVLRTPQELSAPLLCVRRRALAGSVCPLVRLESCFVTTRSNRKRATNRSPLRGSVNERGRSAGVRSAS